MGRFTMRVEGRGSHAGGAFEDGAIGIRDDGGDEAPFAVFGARTPAEHERALAANFHAGLPQSIAQAFRIGVVSDDDAIEA